MNTVHVNMGNIGSDKISRKHTKASGCFHLRSRRLSKRLKTVTCRRFVGGCLRSHRAPGVFARVNAMEDRM